MKTHLEVKTKLEVGAACKVANWSWWRKANIEGEEMGEILPRPLRWLLEYDWQTNPV